MKLDRDFWIINIFALLHALVAILCRVGGIGDGIFLTMLTIAMTVILCVRQKVSIELMTINIILVNIIGYVTGIATAGLLGLFMSSPMAVHGISTFLTTELLGWALVWFLRNFGEDEEDSGKTYMTDSAVRWLIIIIITILGIRILVAFMTRNSLFPGSDITDVLEKFFSNSVIPLMMVFITIVFIKYLKNRKKNFGNMVSAIAIAVFCTGVAVLAALMAGYGLPFSMNADFSISEFMELFVVALICEAAFYSLCYLIDYAHNAHKSMEAERSKANLAQTRYLSLKQQVNPHFLFNSLNILDCLIAEDKNDQARDYVQKLAGLYRYMLKNENEPVAKLEDEMHYVDLFSDLLLVRFPEGLEIVRNIREEDMKRYVVTYSVQMLVENAIKHNAISKDPPLRIDISTDGEKITVTNNLNPKLYQPESTGVGLKYIKRNYLDFSGKKVVITQTDNQYGAALPLL